MKQCATCRVLLPLSSCTRASNQKSGLNCRCRTCMKVDDAARHTRRMADQSALLVHRAGRRAYYARTAAARRARSRQYYALNRAEMARWQREYVQAHPGLMDAARERRRVRKLGVLVNDFTQAQWLELKAAYKQRCASCGTKPRRVTQDHIPPLFLGGSHTLHTIVPACQRCHSAKSVGLPPAPVQPLLLTIAVASSARRPA